MYIPLPKQIPTLHCVIYYYYLKSTYFYFRKNTECVQSVHLVVTVQNEHEFYFEKGSLQQSHRHRFI